MPANTDTQHDAYVTYLSARESNIDLYSLDVIWTAEFARAGWIVELPADYIEGDAFLDGPLQSVTYAGKLYAVPWFTDAGVLYYRKDLLEEAGLPVPETWTEFREACREVAGSRGMEGFVWQGARYEGLVCDFLEFLWSVGGDLDRETLIERPAAAERGIVEALGLMLSFLESDISPGGVLTYKEEDSRRLFTEGQALFLRNWPYAWSMAEGEGSKIKGLAGIAPLPHSEGNTGYSTIGGWNVALSSYSKHPDEALEFLRFITGEKSMKERAIKGGYLPTLKSTYGDPDVLDANPHFSRFFEVFQNTRNRPRSPHYPRISDVIQENVHRALTYGIEPEAAAANIVRELAEIMAE
jgi:multiple sugar transport system substrate-binding protein